MSEGASGHNQVDLAAARTSQRSVQLCRERGFFDTERDRLLAREERILCGKLFGRPRPAPPLVENNGRTGETVTFFDCPAQRWGKTAGAGQCINEDRRIEVNHRL